MHKFLNLIVMALVSFSFMAADADAKRFGGGKSIGKQRSYQQATPRQPAQAPAAAPAPGGNRWLGPLAGLAAGGLLASLFMGDGFEGIKPMDILLLLGIAAAIFFIFRAMRRKQTGALPITYARANTGHQLALESVPVILGGASPSPASSRPPWFEDEPFLREAKVHFIRLQAAYDSADLNDIREYVTPQMFAEISLQIQERGESTQKTDVVTLNAEMLDVVTEDDKIIASVSFSGLIREEASANAEPFEEVWHIQRNLNGPDSRWYISGIQQVV